MKCIIANAALQDFTWKGTNIKDPFIQFKYINEVLKDAIHTDIHPYTDHDHNKCMKEYCKHSTSRLKSKEKQNKQKETSKTVKQTIPNNIISDSSNDEDVVREELTDDMID